MKIMIVGGTGFLGYYTLLDARKKGHQVEVMAIDDVKLEGWFPLDEVKVHFVDVFKTSEEDLVPYFKGFDAMVYSVGPDDRYTPKADAHEFFYGHLVDDASKVLRAAETAGVKRAVVYNSYFSYFDREYPEIQFSKKHLYIKARVDQEEKMTAQAKNMDVMFLELPYIFGSMPERTPLWKDVFLDKFANGKKTIMFPKGGTTMIAVQHVGEAGVGALMYGEHGKKYPVGEENRSYDYFLDTMMIELTGQKRKIWHPAVWMLQIGGKQMMKDHKKKGEATGLDYNYVFKDYMTKDIFIKEEDMKATREALHMTTGGLEEAIKETAKACYRNEEFK